MTQSNPQELTLSRRILRVLLVLNPLFGLGILGMLITSFAAEGFMIRALFHEHGASQMAESMSMIAGMRWIMGLGILGVLLMQVALRRLLAIVETVSAGDPFVILNAERLKTIAWVSMALEALHVVIGTIAHGVSTETHPIDIDMKFNFTRWMVVLFLFVLARVFEQGARMREDLEGTV